MTHPTTDRIDNALYWRSMNLSAWWREHGGISQAKRHVYHARFTRLHPTCPVCRGTKFAYSDATGAAIDRCHECNGLGYVEADR